MDRENNLKLTWKRRRLLVNEHFQLRFIGFTAGVAIVACFFFFVASEYFFARYHSFAVEVGLKPSDPFFSVLHNMENLQIYLFAFTTVCIVVGSIIGGLIFSNRVAGPLNRLRKHCDAVARGETLANLQFRKEDYFRDVVDAYNASLTHLRQKMEAKPENEIRKAS